MAASEIDDEGEGPITASRPPLGPENGSIAPSKINAYSLRGRWKYAWRLLRGQGVEDILTADPAEQIRNARAQQDNRWRGVYAIVLLIGMSTQIAFADWIFWRFLVHNKYEIDSAIFIAFFSSVVVEVIGLVFVVTKSLFPSTDKAT